MRLAVSSDIHGNLPALEAVTRDFVRRGVDTVINRADKALYYVKRHGRNQVCCYEMLVKEGKLTPVQVATGDIELF